MDWTPIIVMTAAFISSFGIIAGVMTWYNISHFNGIKQDINRAEDNLKKHINRSEDSLKERIDRLEGDLGKISSDHSELRDRTARIEGEGDIRGELRKVLDRHSSSNKPPA